MAYSLMRLDPQIIRRYHIQNRDDYKKYNKICGIVTKLVSVMKRLDARDPVRIELTDQVLDKWAPSACLSAFLSLHHCWRFCTRMCTS